MAGLLNCSASCCNDRVGHRLRERAPLVDERAQRLHRGPECRPHDVLGLADQHGVRWLDRGEAAADVWTWGPLDHLEPESELLA